ncbi:MULTISPECIES: CoA ester lyase [unclassified Chelatococcus]|uniref:HpcH/HpaI aldolase/citrate lyase family protein n=1 Tax=unclassified Chelatococcus TaxID=2638111 RepID=UPI001BD16DF2|nr:MULTISPECIES: CoA ester lyase [unclassified Chelatococcus]MBS7739812.1 CoA ester lyase [Chelatococcus sp. HY11]MBX3545456.1 CoA ester lyase [Chelatococcus sp.]MCO5078889.1 CoA ester lyase [Chelatococcus sp.]
MRSLLFIPGDSPRKLEKGLTSGADALLLDLEDAVAPGAKAEARRITADFIAATKEKADRPLLYVRVNGFDTGMVDDDLAGVMLAGPDGIVLPKACGGPDVARLGTKLAVWEAKAGTGDGATRVLALAAESARGIFALGTFADASERLMGLTWGGEDLSADVGAETNRDASGAYTEPYRLTRSLTLLAAAAASVMAVDAVYTNFRDLDGLAAECREGRRDGFVAKMAIHPAQVPVINAAFTPSEEAVTRARAVIAAFRANPDAGVVGVDGEMLDRPHLLRAERVLARLGPSDREGA